jgi:dinuclear metal center YbgI/SA1388 family protein
MAKVSLPAIVRYCDLLLHTNLFQDWEDAANGLQVENRGTVTRLAAAVDASTATIKLALAAGADLLLVHHGLFWNRAYPWTGKRYAQLRLLFDSNLAIYSSHLPLDVHPRLGNNAQLCRALGLRRLTPFCLVRGQKIGLRAQARLPRTDLAKALQRVLGTEPKLIPGGPAVCRRIGVVTGGAGAELRTAALDGVDTFVTGEGPHWTCGVAEELGINLFYAGHYATETLGVKALADHLGRKFVLPWVFLDHPSGL